MPVSIQGVFSLHSESKFQSPRKLFKSQLIFIIKKNRIWHYFMEFHGNKKSNNHFFGRTSRNQQLLMVAPKEANHMSRVFFGGGCDFVFALALTVS